LKHRLRLSLFFALLAFFTLVDEAVKEGYVFDPNDLLSPALTHEKLFIVFLVLSLLLGLRCRSTSQSTK
jgi:hypothetical protein